MAVKTKSCCFPHAGGDVSSNVTEHYTHKDVFPTQVGMFLAERLRSLLNRGFPHAGGDVSECAGDNRERS